MSLKPGPIQPIPEETIQVARAAFPKGNLYLTLRDKLGSIFQDEDFAGLFPGDGQPALATLALGAGDDSPVSGEPVRSS
jgi:transposase